MKHYKTVLMNWAHLNVLVLLSVMPFNVLVQCLSSQILSLKTLTSVVEDHIGTCSGIKMCQYYNNNIDPSDQFDLQLSWFEHELLPEKVDLF